MMHLDPYTWKMIHQVSALEPDYYKRDDLSCAHDKVLNNATLCSITFTSKTFTSTERHYSNTERKALGILHGLETFHHYCFVKEECIIIDNKPLIAIISKDVATLCQ